MADKVVINGSEFVPKESVISKDTLDKLRRASGIAWANGHYDPYHDCDAVTKLREISDLLMAANKELRFKE